MADAFIYDHVRTPRGRGKSDGRCTRSRRCSSRRRRCRRVRDRNDLDTRLLDDCVLGCVAPIGEQGGNIARVAALVAGYDEIVPGPAAEPLLCLGPRSRQQRGRAGHVGPVRGVVAGGVESMSRVPMGADGGAWAPTRPSPADLFRAAGHRRRPDRHARRLCPRRTSMRIAVESQQRAAAAWSEGRFAGSIVPVSDCSATSCSTATNTCAPTPRCRSLAA